MADNDDEIVIHHPPDDRPTIIPNCFGKIVEYCGPLEERGVAAYEGYDKIQVGDDNTLSELDILLANNMRANLSGKNFVRLWRKKEEISKSLEKIPADVSLSDLSLDGESLWEDLRTLFEVCLCEDVRHSKITKILHKKRPHLIPIVDRQIIIGKYLGPNWLNAAPIPEYLIAATKHIRKDIIYNERALTVIRERLRNEKGIDLTVLRIFDILLYQHYYGDP